MLIGGVAGFLIGGALSLAQDNAWSTALWHACAAAYVAGLLMRWWGRAWRKNLALTLEERRNTPATPINPLNALPKTSKS
jgi:hypothetical protein